MSADVTFTTIRSVGGLLPTSLLGRIADLDPTLPGTDAVSFGLTKGQRVTEPVSAAWNVLKGRWRAYQEQLAALDDTARATSETRDFLIRLFDLLDMPLTAGSIAVDGTSYPVSHTATQHPVPVHLLSTRVPIDRTTKGVEGAATRAPHGLVQELLNRSDDHLWALVAGGARQREPGDIDGGLVLRLLRDNQAMSRQAYVEFDLAAMFDGEVYADFVVLWLVLHHTRFAGDRPSDCLLEQWIDEAEEAGARALDTLRNGVEKALVVLGSGLLRHPDNAELRRRLEAHEISGDDVYRQLLRVVYRLLFLFVAEDRDLLLLPEDRAKPQARERYSRWYSTGRLRRMAREVGGGSHGDLWVALTRVMHDLGSDDGCELLALPPLGGGLFDVDGTPDVLGRPGTPTALGNGRLLDAIRALAWTVDDGVVRPIDFRNLGAEELGSVYESLLELVATASATSQTFTLETRAGNARKTTGSYYTPSSLIKVLLDEALDPLLDEAATADDPESALLALTVCDPACGSGHFLVAAAHRIADRLATLRAGEGEPSPTDVQQALRDVVGSCIYGVDMNPMAAELAKVTLWLECHVPGQPMTFLDHHVKVGNSLLGVGFDTSIAKWNPQAKKAADRGGIPDAAFKALAGDDPKAANAYKARSRSLRDDKRKESRLGYDGQYVHAQDLLTAAEDNGPSLADLTKAIDEEDDRTVEGLRRKREAHLRVTNAYAYNQERLVYDAWCAAWTMRKTDERARTETVSPVEIYYSAAGGQSVGLSGEGVRAVARERARMGFFHWTVEFPAIARAGGFVLMIGNPPWEHIELKEKEWFEEAGRADIAAARTAAIRKKMIAALETSADPADIALHRTWTRESQTARATSNFASKSRRYPLGGVGRANTFPLFADAYRMSVAEQGRLGIIVPTAIITDFTFRDFFSHLVDERRLVSAFDFINKAGLFPDVGTVYQFVLLVVAGGAVSAPPKFAFNIVDTAQLSDPGRTYEMAVTDISLVNPNTRTSPVFLSARDAEVTTDVYRRLPPLVRLGTEPSNPWQVRFKQGLFNMASDSGLFRTDTDLERQGWVLDGNQYTRAGKRMLPLLEAKLFNLWRSDATTYHGVPLEKRYGVKAGTLALAPGEVAQPRYWVPEGRVEEEFNTLGWDESYVLVWRDVTRATQSARTTIAALVPRTALPHPTLIAVPGKPASAIILAGVFSSFAFDYLARQKLSGAHLAFYIMEQLPVPPPGRFMQRCAWGVGSISSWVATRSVALSAVTEQMATALGRSTQVPYDAVQRRLWKTELDAGMFHLYGYPRTDVEHVLDSFTIVASKERATEDLADDDPNWRTKRLILAKYDELQRCIDTGTPYVSPDEPPPLPEKLRLDLAALA